MRIVGSATLTLRSSLTDPLSPSATSARKRKSRYVYIRTICGFAAINLANLNFTARAASFSVWSSPAICTWFKFHETSHLFYDEPKSYEENASSLATSSVSISLSATELFYSDQNALSLHAHVSSPRILFQKPIFFCYFLLNRFPSFVEVELALKELPLPDIDK